MNKKIISEKARQLLKSLSSPEGGFMTKDHPERVRVSTKKEETKPKRPSRTVGISLHLEDRQKIKDVSIWFTSQGIKASDSMIVQCAIRMLTTGKGLIDTYHHVRSLDQRIKIK